MMQRCASGAVNCWPDTTTRTTGVERKRMKIQKKRLVQMIPGMTPAHLNIKPVQVDAVITALLAILAAHKTSRVLEFMEGEEKKRCDKLGE